MELLKSKKFYTFFNQRLFASPLRIEFVFKYLRDNLIKWITTELEGEIWGPVLTRSPKVWHIIQATESGRSNLSNPIKIMALINDHIFQDHSSFSEDATHPHLSVDSSTLGGRRSTMASNDCAAPLRTCRWSSDIFCWLLSHQLN